MSAAVPFTIAIPQTRLDRILNRVREYDWDAVPDAGGWDAGIGKADLQRLCTRWTTGYDWRAEEARLNQLPHFKAEMDGQAIHFLHIRGSGPAGRPPILLVHGWPGSFHEFLEAAPRLAHPEQFGGRAEDGFDLVIPSLPGYVFSTPLKEMTPPRGIAALFHKLLTEVLGYPRYIAQGGDWGAGITAWIALDNPATCAGLHNNLSLLRAPGFSAQTPEEAAYLEYRSGVDEAEGGYSHIQRTRPQTLGFALEDSPVGAAAWIIEKFGVWSDVPRTDGVPDLGATYSDDQLITNAMLYIATNTLTTAAWLYRAAARVGRFNLSGKVTVPTAIAAFPDPVFRCPPRSFVEQSYNVVQWVDPAGGGHFGAMERPEIFADAVRTFALTVA